MNKTCIIFLFVISLVGESLAQQHTMPGRVLFKIKSEQIEAFRAAFANTEINSTKFDPQKFSLKDENIIKDLLALPGSFHVTSLKPLIPEHNIVLEKLREQTNPFLFVKTNQNGVRIWETEETAKLRSAEENISRWFELFFESTTNIETAIVNLKKSGMIEVAEPRYRYNLCFTPNDPLFSQQYSLPLIHAPEAWDIVKCDSTIIVADDDIGAEWTHPDLANAMYINSEETGIDSEGFDKRSNGIDDDRDGYVDNWHGWDFAGTNGTAPDNDPMASAAHGTHTTGIMAASGNNKLGICGVALGAKALVLKCADDNGQDVAFGYEGIIYAADHHAQVVNNSWGGTNRTQVGEDIINYAVKKNCAVVAASGNGGVQESNDHRLEGLYPASYQHVLSVSALDPNGKVTDFSNYNTQVDVAAPGFSVISTVPGNTFSEMSGTSMASPTAAGAVALVRKKFPELDADQAIQRLRATSDFIDSDHDAHPGFSGKGKINLSRAVTENPVFSARLESVEIFDEDHNGALESGETGDIVLHVKNYLSPLSNLTATIEFIGDTGKFLNTSTQVINFGKVNTLSLIQNFQGSFLVGAYHDVPNNYTVLVKVTFSSPTDGYFFDIDYFTLIINKGYLDLNKNNLTVTFDGKGNIGYSDPPNNSQGSGFLWTNAPPSITVSGRDVLFAAGLMVGSDPDHIVAAAPSQGNDQIAEQDFSAIMPIKDIPPTDHPNAIQELETVIADLIPGENQQVGIIVDQKSYAFTKELAANAVVLDYTLHKRDNSNATDETSAALFMDWDIGSSGSLNTAYSSSLDDAIAITRRLEDLYPYIGIKLISDIPEGAALNFYALDNDGSNGSAKTYGGFIQSDKWLTMTTSRSTAGIGDVSMIYGLKDLSLLSNDSLRLTFIIAMAENENLLKTTIDQTQREWLKQSVVTMNSVKENSISISPNPFSTNFHIHLPNQKNAISIMEISDELGRTLLHQVIEGSSYNVSGLHFPAGSYLLTIRQGTDVIRQKIVCLP
jgi:serine protease